MEGSTFNVLSEVVHNKWWIVVFIMAMAIGAVSAQITEEPDVIAVTPTAFDFDEIPKSAITLGILGVCLVIGLGIAKLVDYCYVRTAIRDDASDMSDFTRDLLKAQVFLMTFKRGGKDAKKAKPREIAKKLAKVWLQKATLNRAMRLKAEREKDDKKKHGLKPAGTASAKQAFMMKKNSTAEKPFTIQEEDETKVEKGKKVTDKTNLIQVEEKSKKAAKAAAGAKATVQVIDETDSKTLPSDTPRTGRSTAAPSKVNLDDKPQASGESKANPNQPNKASRPISAGLKANNNSSNAQSKQTARPGTAKSRPGTAKRPSTAKSRATTTTIGSSTISPATTTTNMSRPSTAKSRPGTAKGRPGTAKKVAVK